MSIPSWLTVSTDGNKKSELEITIMDGQSDYPDVCMALSSCAELMVVNVAGPIYKPECIDGLEVNSLLERRDKVASILAGDAGVFERLFFDIPADEITPPVVVTGTDLLIAATLNSLS